MKEQGFSMGKEKGDRDIIVKGYRRKSSARVESGEITPQSKGYGSAQMEWSDQYTRQRTWRYILTQMENRPRAKI